MDKAPDAFRTISEVADDLDVPQHVLRFWETRFSQIKPMKRSGGRRYYRPDDVDLLRGIRRLLYGEGYTIRGVQRIFKEHGVKSVQALANDPDSNPSGPRARPASPGPHEGNAPAPAAVPEAEDEDAGIESPVWHEPRPPSSRLVAPVVRAEPDREAQPSADNTAVAAIADGGRKLDEERLKAALSELLACRQLLDDALKDG